MHPIYLIDDDQDVIESLGWMLSGLAINSQAYQSADAFLQAVDIHQAGIAILDINMPGIDGMALLTHLKQANSPIAVIMLTGYGSISLAVKSIQDGAIDFLEKPVDGEQLVNLLERANHTSQQRWQQYQQQQQVQQRLALLTPRETQVMQQVLSGKLNKVIAAELNISQRTIELHRHNVMQKMQVNNVAELAHLLIQ